MKISATYEREIEHKPVRNVIFSTSLALTLITLTVIFGIDPAIKSLTANTKYKQELTDIKNKMERKVLETLEGERILKEYSENVEALNNSVTTKVELEKFIQELVLTTSNTGFIVYRIRQDDSYNNEAYVNMEMTGPLAQMPKLVEAIENMNRFTRIDEIQTYEERNEMILRMKVTIFTM